MAASKLLQQTKICSVLALKSLLPQLMSFLGNDLKNPEVVYKKGGFKNSAKITEKHLCWGLFFNKDSCRGPSTLLQRDSSIGVFL